MSGDSSRNFALRDTDGTETSVFSGKRPRQAALKAARRIEAALSEQEAAREELRLRERGTKKVHVYEGWAWEEPAPEDAPEWLSGTVTKANVAKQGIEHIDEL